MSKNVIFHDESLQRWKILKRIGMATAFIAVIVTTVFVVSLLVIPVLQPETDTVNRPKKLARIFPARKSVKYETELKNFMLKRVGSQFRAMLKKEKKQYASKNTDAQKSKIVAAFYATWQESGIHSLRAHADKLTHIMPEWLHLSPDGAGLQLFDWAPVPHNSDVIQICRQSHVKIMPILNNAEGSVFDEKRVHSLLAHPEKQKILIDELKQWLIQNQFQGINIDFENLNENDNALLPVFLKRLSSVLHKAGLEVSTDIEAESPASWKDIAQQSDFVIMK